MLCALLNIKWLVFDIFDENILFAIKVRKYWSMLLHAFEIIENINFDKDFDVT